MQESRPLMGPMRRRRPVRHGANQRQSEDVHHHRQQRGCRQSARHGRWFDGAMAHLSHLHLGNNPISEPTKQIMVTTMTERSGEVHF